MTDPPDPQPSATQIGRGQINAPGSQGFINRTVMIGELARRLIEGQGAVAIAAKHNDQH